MEFKVHWRSYLMPPWLIKNSYWSSSLGIGAKNWNLELKVQKKSSNLRMRVSKSTCLSSTDYYFDKNVEKSSTWVQNFNLFEPWGSNLDAKLNSFAYPFQIFSIQLKWPIFDKSSNCFLIWSSNFSSFNSQSQFWVPLFQL